MVTRREERDHHTTIFSLACNLSAVLLYPTPIWPLNVGLSCVDVVTSMKKTNLEATSNIKVEKMAAKTVP